MKHFYDLQELANIYQTQVIQVFGVAGHGKGEVHHVGGTAKVAISWEIASGKLLLDCDYILDFLKDKFEPSKQTYVFNETTEQKHDIERAQVNQYKYYTIPGLSKFHVMIDTPKSLSFKASNIICVCSSCQLEYGSCSNFEEYPLQVHEQTSQARLRYSHLQEDELTVTMQMKQILMTLFSLASL